MIRACDVLIARAETCLICAQYTVRRSLAKHQLLPRRCVSAAHQPPADCPVQVESDKRRSAIGETFRAKTTHDMNI